MVSNQSSSTYSDETVTRWITILIFLCLFDLLFTITEIELGWATEFNPILNWIIENFGVVGFSSLKMTLTLASCIVFFLFKEKLISQVGIILALTAYVAVFAYHIMGILFWT